MSKESTLNHTALVKRSEILERQSRSYANLVDTLLEFEQVLATTTSVEGLYNNLQKQTALITPHHSFALLLVQDDASYAIESVGGVSGIGLNHLKRTADLLINEGIFAQAVRRRHPVHAVIPHTEALLSPITHDGQMIGMLLLVGCTKPDSRTQDVLGHLSQKAGNKLFTLYKRYSENSEPFENSAAFNNNTFDPLTGLMRRKEWIESISNKLPQEKTDAHFAAVLLINLDGFWRMKQHFGEQFITGIIKYIAGRIHQTFIDPDICSLLGVIESNSSISRIGLDEFAIFIPYLEKNAPLDKVITHLHRRLSEGFVLDGTPIYVTASIGVSCCPNDATDTSTLLKHADIALKHAKQTGRDRYSHYTAEMQQINVIGLGLEQTLHRALQENRLFFHYQPQLDLSSSKITALEALLRMRNDRNELISPAIFIPLAEQIGLAHKIGAWGLRAVCRQLKTWQNSGFIQVPVSVNLSAQQLNQPNLVESYSAILNEEGISPDRIELEITETTLSHDEEQAVKNIHQLHKAGFRIILDDFGAGYSTLASLSQLPIDGIKIDKLFISELGIQQQSTAIVASLIEMANRINISIIAEGVETPEQLQQLKNLNCPLAQGFLISKPLEAEKVAEEFLGIP